MNEREFTDQQLDAARTFFGCNAPKTRQIRAFIRTQPLREVPAQQLSYQPKTSLVEGQTVIFESTDAYFHPQFAPYSQRSPQAVAKMVSYGIIPRRVL